MDPSILSSVRVSERLALPTSDNGVAGSNPAGGEILPEPKRRFTAQSLSCSPFHHLEMTEILLKGLKTLTHPSFHPYQLDETIFNFRSVWYIFFMPPTSKKLREHIGFGLSVRASIRSSKTVHARVLKFHIWIPHGKIADTRFFFFFFFFFFLVRVISLSGVMPI